MPTRGSAWLAIGEAVVEVAAHAQVEEPVASLDLVFDVERQFLYVGVAEVVVVAAAAGQVVGRKNGVDRCAIRRLTLAGAAHCDGSE